MNAEENNPYKMPDGETVPDDFPRLDMGVYSGELVDFGVHETHPIVFMVVKPSAELMLLDPTHRKSKKKTWAKYDPPNLKVVKKIDDDQTYRISLFIGTETSRYPQYFYNSKGELKRCPPDKSNLPPGMKLLSQREEVLIDLAKQFDLGGKEIPHPDGSGFAECLASFLAKECSGRKIVFQAKDNGDYTNYFLKNCVTEDELKQIKGF